MNRHDCTTLTAFAAYGGSRELYAVNERQKRLWR